MSDPIQILLLGQPAVYYGEELLDIPRREVRGLLYYLACQPGPVSRGRLIQLLWADLPEESARKRLRETLARLRKSLPGHVHLLKQNDHLLLERSGFHSDVLDFMAIVEQVVRPLAQMPTTAPLPETLYQSMVRGVKLWRSAGFLMEGRLPDAPGWENWQRDLAHQLLNVERQRMLERLADHDLATGNLKLAAGWLEKALEVDPVNDALHLRMINLYDRAGNYSEGLAYLQKARERYAEDDLPIPLALKQMDQRLREKLTEPRGNQTAGWPGRRMMQLPFFGRRAELEKLQGTYHRGGVALLLGEAGSGKTRLVQELYNRLKPAPRLLIALARPLETDLPFQPLIDMLRSQVTSAEWRELPKSWLAALALLLPELNVVFPELVELQASDSLTQPVLFEALRQGLTLLSRDRRLLLFLDDVQWCDETTLNAITFLYEHDFFGERAALVMACRSEDQPPALQHLLTYLSHRNAPEQVNLPPLAPEDVASLARYVLGVELSDQVVERFERDTGGNPLFLLESLRTLLEYPLELRKTYEMGHLPISGSMHALIHQRLERLSPDSSLVLTVAAVIGSEMELDVLEQACNIGPDRLVNALEELERRHLLHAVGSGQPRETYHFNHDRIREIIHIELSPARRRIYHLRVANALKYKYGSADAAYGAVLAFHYENAGELQTAFAYWVKAADHARRLYSLVEAEAAYHNAQKLLDQLDQMVSDQDVFHLYNGWIDFAFNTGNADSLQSAAQRMLQVGFRRENRMLIGRAYLGLAGVADLRDQAEEGLQYLEEARPYLEKSGGAVLWLRFHNRRGGFLILQNRYGEAIRDLEQALELVEDPNDATQIEARSSVRYRLAQAYLQNGWPARSLQQGELVLDESRAMLNHAGGLLGITTIAIAEHFMGRYASSIEHARTALRMAAPMKNMWLAGTIQVSLAKAQLAAGQLDGAWEQARLAMESVSDQPAARIVAQALRVQGDVMGFLDNLEEAQKCYRKGLEAADPNYSMVDNQFRLGWQMALSGQGEEGSRLLDEVIDFCIQNELTLHLMPARVAKAWALLAQGRMEDAVRMARSAAALAVEREMPTVHAMAFTVLAAAALQDGRKDEAVQKGRVVMREGREMGNPGLEIRAIGLILSALEPSSPEAAELSARASQLIVELEKNCRSPVLRPSYERFLQRLAELQIR